MSTGSTPWIDIFSSYEDEVKVVKGELRIGESGLYNIASKLYFGETPEKEEFVKVSKSLIEFGESSPVTSRFFLAFLRRLPFGVSALIPVNRQRKRSYEKLLPGFTLYSSYMLKELEWLIINMNSLDSSSRRIKIKKIMNKYIKSLESCCYADDQIIIDQLVSPRLLFDEKYGYVIAEIFDHMKFIVVRRDPRDQFIDLLRKKKKNYHLMKPEEASIAFINEYLPRYDRMLSMLDKDSDCKIVDVWFEDIFFNFEEVLIRLESFIGLKSRPSAFNSFNFSEASSKVKMYNCTEYSKEIALIEDRMRRHLYLP
ncbi:sulfotransferase [Vreelandella sulfidaeris]|uniref:sulfotransferase n=1 Tax=Vreelandella sulfidaeris TaxID=115553 RepID=UPI0035E7AD23